MTPGLAIQRGTAHGPVAVFKSFADEGSAVACLVAFMASAEAHTLEQEELDPVIPI
jgi:hypothetical protein